jgi:hypothetical protein
MHQQSFTGAFSMSDKQLLFAAPRAFKGSMTPWSLLPEVSSTALNEIARQLEELKIPPSPASLSLTSQPRNLQESLFDATASVKILAAQVAMHMDKNWREKLFRQIDSLHDLEEWDSEDKPIRRASFATFLKAILQVKPQRHPGLGLSYEGYLIAAWTLGQDRLITEYLPNDRVRWILTRHIDGEIERASGQTIVSRLTECLAAYQPEHWFFDAKA